MHFYIFLYESALCFFRKLKYFQTGIVEGNNKNKCFQESMIFGTGFRTTILKSIPNHKSAVLSKNTYICYINIFTNMKSELNSYNPIHPFTILKNSL